MPLGPVLSDERLTLYGSFTSSSSYKPMLYLALAGLLRAMPGFAPPYDLIPSKDREFPAAPHYAPP